MGREMGFIPAMITRTKKRKGRRWDLLFHEGKESGIVQPCTMDARKGKKRN